MSFGITQSSCTTKLHSVKSHGRKTHLTHCTQKTELLSIQYQSHTTTSHQAHNTKFSEFSQTQITLN